MKLRNVARLAAAALACGFVPVAAFAQGAPAAATAAHVKVETLQPGKGDKVPEHSYVLINYKGTLTDGKVFDQAQNAALPLDEVVPGFTQGIVGMQRGGKYRLTIPPELGYGADAVGPIPANSTLVFEIDLIDFKTIAEVTALMAEQTEKQADAKAAAQ